MKKIIIIVLIIFLVFILLLISHKKYSYEDENTLYVASFKNTILRFERLDYALGQNQIVTVQESSDNGKSFTSITKDPITLSLEPLLIFLNENLGFAITSSNLSQNNNYQGFKVTLDGGKTFTNSQINYTNPDIETISIEDLPYLEDNILKLKCLIYQLKDNNYEDIELIFISNDSGLTWNLEN